MSEIVYRIEVASDIHNRDGIGITLYKNEKEIIEVFRDDSDKTRSISIFTESVSLDEMTNAIESFKKEITWSYQE